ncbi:MAG: nicotinate phosphoribosyltransferase, partial [Chlamydiia bacterium]|nr:nicotinate phosphoribosyltransferase [Chlamydiia bacterium]
FIGGCSGTSNTLAAKLFGIPVVGTHAHSWIMAFDDEKSAFTSFAKALPQSCVFLIDTYNTIEGVKNAIAVAQEMKKSGHQMIGVRLDSGDLAKLSIQVRNLLDQAGLQEAKIMASNELDEYVIRDLKQQGCKITIWGVGTNLVTGKEQPALDGVYKLSAIQNSEKKWEYKLKVSEQWAKVTNPGLLQLKRFYLDDIAVGDSIYDLYQSPSANELIDVFNPSNQQVKNPKWTEKDLLVPIMRQGVVVYEFPTLDRVRATAAKELETIPLETRRFLNPQAYCVGLEKTLYHLKLRLLQAFRDRLC